MVVSVAPAFNDSDVVTKKGKGMMREFEGGNCVDE